jgi:hypothetical protein
VNHTTTIGIAAILALAVASPGILAVGTAYAGGHGRSHGDGDSFVAKTLTKQKNLCWAVDNSRTDCENNASVFGERENNDNNNNNQCPRELAGVTVTQNDGTCTATGDPNVITGGVCNSVNGQRTVSGEQNPQATCTFPATRA